MHYYGSCILLSINPLSKGFIFHYVSHIRLMRAFHPFIIKTAVSKCYSMVINRLLSFSAKSQRLLSNQAQICALFDNSP